MRCHYQHMHIAYRYVTTDCSSKYLQRHINTRTTFYNSRRNHHHEQYRYFSNLILDPNKQSTSSSSSAAVTSKHDPSRTCLIFTGQGSHRIGMGIDIYKKYSGVIDGVYEEINGGV